MSLLNANGLPHLVSKLSDSKNIKIKNTRLSNEINRIVEKADDITRAVDKEVTNSSSSFKLDSESLDSFSDINIKGVTYHNLFNGADFPHNIGVPLGVNNNINTKKLKIGLKPNTVYTVILNCTTTGTLTTDILLQFVKYNPWVGKKHIYLTNARSTGMYIGKLTMPTDTSEIDAYTFGINVNDYKDIGITINNAILLEGDHTNNPNLPTYFEGIQGVGNKSKNLFNNNEASLGYVNSEGTFVSARNNIRSNYIEIKANTNYVASVIGSLGSGFGFSWFDNNKNFIIRNVSNSFDTSPSNAKYLILHNNYGGVDANNVVKIEDVKIQVEEGTSPSPYQPFGTHKIEILSNNKSLFDFYGKENTSFTLPNLFEVGKTYTLSADIDNQSNYETRVRLEARHYDGTSSYYGAICKSGQNKRVSQTFTISKPYEKLLYVFQYLGYNPIGVSKASNVMLTEGSNDIYEPYRQHKTQILLDEPLMQLPNGVTDEIKDDKLIRRVGKVVLDGSENWVVNSRDTNTTRFTIPFTLSNKDNRLGYCDTIFHRGNGLHGDYSYIVVISGIMYVNMYNTTLTTADVKGFKQWLSQNPTTVYYELETPIITELEPPKVRLFKDGHLTFNTLIPPISTYKVPINKNSQIENNVKEVQLLDNRVEHLESFFDQALLENQHKLKLLNLDFNYMKGEE